MKLSELLKTVYASAPAQWPMVAVEIPHNWEENEDGQLRHNCFDSVYVYEDDADISLAMGAVVNRRFEEKWANSFPNPHAQSMVVALRYRGNIVHQWTFVEVDGGRYLLPIPERTADGEMEIREADLALPRLFFELYDSGLKKETLETCLRRAGVKIVAKRGWDRMKELVTVN